MSQRTRPQVVRSYLAELESALAVVPTDVARDILDGVAEELAGLDSAAAATRIEELGDPMFIAAAARAESVDPSGVVDSLNGDAGAGSHPESRGYVVFVSLLVAFGGVVIPVLGWIVGLVLMWLSRRWRTWEKWVATVAVPAVALLIGAIGLAFSGGVLFGFAGWHLMILVGLLGVGNVVAGLWLLWRGLHRPAADRIPTPAAARGGAIASDDAQWYIVLTGLLVAFGGIVLPLLGWVFGIAMVWVSKTWHTWEKWTATLAPALMLAVSVVLSFGLRSLTAEPGVGDSSGLHGPAGDLSRPLLLPLVDTWWFGIVLMGGLNVLVGVWLLWRGLRRPR
jgi:hypothetical protein